MRTYPLKTAIVPIVLACVLGLGVGLVRADMRQHGTPAAGTGSGVTTEALGQVEPAAAPGQALFLLRVTFAPGGMVGAHVHPGATIYYIAEGTLQFELLDGSAEVVRAGDGTSATPAAAEPIPIGQEIALNAGDTVYYDGTAVQTERNDGDTPAVVLVSNLRGADEPAREFVDE